MEALKSAWKNFSKEISTTVYEDRTRVIPIAYCELLQKYINEYNRYRVSIVKDFDKLIRGEYNQSFIDKIELLFERLLPYSAKANYITCRIINSEFQICGTNVINKHKTLSERAMRENVGNWVNLNIPFDEIEAEMDKYLLRIIFEGEYQLDCGFFSDGHFLYFENRMNINESTGTFVFNPVLCETCADLHQSMVNIKIKYYYPFWLLDYCNGGFNESQFNGIFKMLYSAKTTDNVFFEPGRSYSKEKLMRMYEFSRKIGNDSSGCLFFHPRPGYYGIYGVQKDKSHQCNPHIDERQFTSVMSKIYSYCEGRPNIIFNAATIRDLAFNVFKTAQAKEALVLFLKQVEIDDVDFFKTHHYKEINNGDLIRIYEKQTNSQVRWKLRRKIRPRREKLDIINFIDLHKLNKKLYLKLLNKRESPVDCNNNAFHFPDIFYDLWEHKLVDIKERRRILDEIFYKKLEYGKLHELSPDQAEDLEKYVSDNDFPQNTDFIKMNFPNRYNKWKSDKLS